MAWAREEDIGDRSTDARPVRVSTTPEYVALMGRPLSVPETVPVAVIKGAGATAKMAPIPPPARRTTRQDSRIEVLGFDIDIPFPPLETQTYGTPH